MKAQRLLFCIILCVLSFTTAYAQFLDFGDAPDSYGTTLSRNGPRHKVGGLVGLGSFYGPVGVDTEIDGQPNSMANGDDTNGPNDGSPISYSDDENAVDNFLAVPLSKSSFIMAVQVENASGVDATVSAWIDFNKNGIFDLNERTQTTVPSAQDLAHYTGTRVTLTWNGLSGLTEGITYARIRIALNAAEVANPTGLANSGEVEDYTVPIKDMYDFGDAPETYGTLLKDDGPRHLINNSNTIGEYGQLWIGYNPPTAEDDGKPSALANADEIYGGVKFIPYQLTTASKSFSAEVVVTSWITQNVVLSGWVDFNRNGVFETVERAQTQVFMTPASKNLLLTWSGLSNLTPGQTYVRIRVASDASSVENPTGLASDGVVEDYNLTIQAAMPVDITLFKGRWIEGKGNQLNWSTAWERDNDRFEIQSSRDAKSFESIGHLTGKGTTNAAQSYTFIDAQPLDNLTYYRLKQVDSDGHFNFSTIISIRRGDDPMKESLLIYPNPTTALLQLQVSNHQNVSDVTIYTASGRRVHYQNGFSSSMSVASLPAGVYVLELKTVSGQVLQQRFIKQ